MANFDSLLIVGFGGPEKPEDLDLYLQRVTQGRNVPAARLAMVKDQYMLFGGESPINALTRQLRDNVQDALLQRSIELPVYYGNRNWDPLLPDVVRTMRANGHINALAFVTSAYSSYSGCRQYRENLDDAVERLPTENNGIAFTKIRQYFNHPGFIEPLVDEVISARSRLRPDLAERAALLCTAHSIPLSSAATSRYQAQLQETADLIATRSGFEISKLVYQSRSGPPSIPWLEPDINDYLTSQSLSANETRAVVVAPIGFVFDHMEVLYDLDHQAKTTAQELNIEFQRASTPGTDARFVEMVVDLVEEQTQQSTPAYLGSLGVVSCLGAQCCLTPGHS